MRKRIVVVIITFVLLLCSCGKQAMDRPTEGNAQTISEQETTDEEEIRWMLQEIMLPDADATLADFIPENGDSQEMIYSMVGDTIYRIVMLQKEEMETIGICIQKLEPPYTAWENAPIYRDEWIDNEYCYAKQVALGQDGIIHILLEGIIDENNRNYYMAEWSENGVYTTKQISDEYFTDEFQSNIKNSYVDAENSTYFVTGEGVQYFDKEFSEKKEWLDTGYIWQIAENATAKGKVYLCGSSIDGGFCIWTTEGKTPLISSEDISMDSTDKVVFVNETDGFLCNVDGIWQFSMKDGQIENCLSFCEHGYTVEKVCGVTVKEDATLLMMVMVDGGYVLLKKVEDKSFQDKVELEFATTLVSPFLQEAVVDFNKQSEDCYIVLREPKEGEAFIDFQTRIQTEVSSGEGPALLSDDVLDINTIAKKGFLRNVAEDFRSQKEQMLENIRVVGEIENESYAIPYSFGVNTLVTSADIVGEKESWTSEEMIQYVKASGAKSAISCYEGAEFFSLLTIYAGNGEGVVDWESGKSYFNNEKVVSLLRFAEEYGDMGTCEDQGIRIAEGEALATCISISCLREPQIMEALFQGKKVYIGFPVEKEESSHILFSNSLSINQSCEYPEGAVAFIKYLLSEEMQDKLAKEACESVRGSSGFPVYSKALDNMFLYAEEKQEADFEEEASLVNYGGYEYIEKPLSVESLKKVREFLLSAKPVAKNADNISNIICEETPAYFSGEKSGQEVCDIIQNRVQLYLDEM